MKKQGKRIKGIAIISIIAIIVIVIALIGMGSKGGMFIYKHYNEKHRSTAIPEAAFIITSKNSMFSSSGLLQLTRSFFDYQVVTENDLFKPLGWQKTIESTKIIPKPIVQQRVVEQQNPPEPVNELVLTGIVRLGDELVAIVEDAQKGEAHFLRKGDRLKDYTVETIAEDKIILVNDGSMILSTLGSKTYYNSNGQFLISQRTDLPATGDAMRSTNEKPAPLDEGSADTSLIERMKARRRKELGQE